MSRKGNYRLDTAKQAFRIIKKKFPNDKEIRELCDNTA